MAAGYVTLTVRDSNNVSRNVRFWSSDGTATGDLTSAAFFDADQLAGLASEETLEAILAKLIAAPASEAKLEQVRALLAGTLAVSGPASAALATETTLAGIKTVLESQRDLAASLWTDNSGAFYLRRDVIDQDSGTVTVTWTTADGTTSAGPGAGARPAASDSRFETIEGWFDVLTTGTGYTAGDLLARIVVLSYAGGGAAPTVAAALWVNATTGLAISAPTAGHVSEVSNNVVASPSPAQDPIFDHANGIKVTVTASAVVFTPPAGCYFAQFDVDVGTFIRTDDVAAADAAGAYRLIADQDRILPVTPGLAVRAYCPTSAVLRIIPMKVRA